MKKGDTVISAEDATWKGKVQGVTKSGNVRLTWLTGPLKGREALVPRTHLREAEN